MAWVPNWRVVEVNNDGNHLVADCRNRSEADMVIDGLTRRFPDREFDLFNTLPIWQTEGTITEIGNIPIDRAITEFVILTKEGKSFAAMSDQGDIGHLINLDMIGKKFLFYTATEHSADLIDMYRLGWSA